MESDQVAILEDEIAAADFIVNPAEPNELRVRVRRMVTDALRRRHPAVPANWNSTPPPTRPPSTASPIDLTYMEYELLRYFVENQGRVWSREQLLSKVWGYDYFGGARTVDVHVRRLRSKIGEERAGWITTVRSVGYRFGVGVPPRVDGPTGHSRIAPATTAKSARQDSGMVLRRPEPSFVAASDRWTLR